ncbi:phosphoglycerate kinase [Patescibacteria group bacterium]
MKLRTADSIDVKNKRVILRIHLDVHFIDESGEQKIEDETRLHAALPIINDYIKRGAKKIVLMSWCQRPKGKVVESMRMRPIGKRLSELLNKEIIILDECCGPKVVQAIDQAPDGSILLLENVRFSPGEKSTKGLDLEYAKALSETGDIFVNDAFGQSHRPVASIIGIPKFIPSFAGPALVKEVEQLSKLLENPPKPFVAVIGGAKISTKMGVITKLMEKVDNLLLGGALANTILLAKGIQVGTSVIEESMIDFAKNLALTDPRLHIPIDVVTGEEMEEGTPTRTTAVGNVKENEKILDIGPDTIKLYEKVLQTAKTIVWNGPMGYFELKEFSKGTDAVAKLIADTTAKTIIGGGETISSITRMGLQDKVSFISMGGGAMLEFLEKGTLPGIEPLRE